MANPSSIPEPFLQLIEGKPDLCGRFTEIKRLGQNGGGGHFSLVFEAYDQTLDQRVALKFLDPSVNDPYRIESFAREIEVLGRLQKQKDILQRYSEMQEITEPFQHPLGMVLSIPMKFYATELAAGDFGTMLDTYDLEPADKLEHFRIMCRAIQRIHRVAIVHRDVKPSNFLVMPDGSLRLSDFGTARCLLDTAGPLKRYTGPPGDWTYASPETIAALHDIAPEIAYASDIYALGAVLFELFTGTALNVHLFSRSVLTDLNILMRAVLPGDKFSEFHKTIESISNKHPLPDIRDFGDVVPKSIASIVNRMYRSLSSLDYRQRSINFAVTFLQIDQCLVVLRNETAFKRWLERKRTFRRSREQKLSARGATLINGAEL